MTTADRKRKLTAWQETLLLLVIALVLAATVKALLLQAFYIPSASMQPGLVENDRILVQKVSYWGSGTPQRGDVVVFEDPGDWLPSLGPTTPSNPIAGLLSKVGLFPTGGHLVKRVVGVAGDTIVCCDAEGRISVNGVPLDENGYIEPQKICNGPMLGKACDWSAGPVPDGSIFVMGDNRNDSADSSFHLCRPANKKCVPGDEYVDTSLVVGKVFALVWPLSHLSWIGRPDSFADVPDGS